jgi:hypothetical protein
MTERIDTDLQNLRRYIAERRTRENTFIYEAEQQMKAILDSLEECNDELKTTPVSGEEEQAKLQQLSTGIQAAIEHLNNDFPVGDPGQLVAELNLRQELKQKKKKSLFGNLLGKSKPTGPTDSKKPGFLSSFFGSKPKPVDNPIQTGRDDFGLNDDTPYRDGAVRNGDEASLGGWKTPKRKRRKVTRRRTSFS